MKIGFSPWVGTLLSWIAKPLQTGIRRLYEQLIITDQRYDLVIAIDPIFAKHFSSVDSSRPLDLLEEEIDSDLFCGHSKSRFVTEAPIKSQCAPPFLDFIKSLRYNRIRSIVNLILTPKGIINGYMCKFLWQQATLF